MLHDPSKGLDMGAKSANLDSEMWLPPKGTLHLSHSPLFIEASVVGCHVKSYPRVDSQL